MEAAKLIAAVLTELADNSQGNITPEFIRNSVMSLFPDYGIIYNNALKSVAIGSTSVYYPCYDSTIATLVFGQNFAKESGTGALQYTGTSSIRNVLLVAALSVSMGVTIQNLEFRFTQGTSTDIAHSHQLISTNATYEPRSCTLIGFVPAPLINSFWGVQVRNISNTNTVIIDKAITAAIGLPRYTT